jgi:probable F420-dependent oxidoreductase
MTAMPLLGFGLPVSGAWATRDTICSVARRAEDLGLSSLWTFQRMLRPVEVELGPWNDCVLDPVVALALAAAQTDRIHLGTATMCAPFLAPALLAKAMATLDVVSGGRVIVGLGLGWMPQEFVAAGIPFERRGARMDEYLRCLEALWTKDPVDFVGEFYTVPRSYVRPRPVQQPHPPVLLGGTAPAALRRAGRLAQGWISSSTQDHARLATDIRVVKAGAREGGRDPADVRIVARVVPDLVPSDPGPSRSPFHGTREQILHDLAVAGEQGVTDVLLDLNLSHQVSGPKVEPASAVDYAERVLEAFAPVNA